MKNTIQTLTEALAKVVSAAGHIEVDSPDDMELGQAVLEGQHVLQTMGGSTNFAVPQAAGDWPEWQVRYCRLKGRETELVAAVYDANGWTVCRVNAGSQYTGQITRLLAAAPRLRNTLLAACKTMRGFGCCVYPDCEGCKIGEVLAALENMESGAANAH